MKKNIRILTLIIILLLQYNHLFAAKYYFSSSSGDDSRTSAQAQNPATPWKSIDKLNAIFSSLQPGDEVLFKRGDVFYGTIHINASGAQGRPITIGAYGSGNKPIITSLISLTNWTHVGNGVYESHHPALGSNVDVVLVDNEMREMGRYPNSNTKNKGYITFNATNGHNNIVASGLSGNWSGGEVVIRKSHWTIDRYKIVSQFGNILSFNQTAGNYSPVKGYGFFIQNHPNTLDVEGEWYYNPSSKKLRVHFGGSQPSSKRVEASSLDYLVTNTRDRGFIAFDNIHFKGANKGAFNILRSSHFQIRNCDIDYSGENGVTIQDSPNILIENSKVNYSNNNGIDLKGNAANAVVKNNKVENTGVFAGMGRSGIGNGIGIVSGSDNNLIEYNEIRNTGYVGIRFGGNSTVVKNNLIDSFCMTKDDGAAIYTWTGSNNTEFHGRKIIGNIILNGVGAPEGTPSNHDQVEGIYLDDNSSGVEIANNTVAYVPGKGIFLHNSRNVVVQNNTLYNNGVQLRLAHDRLGNPIRNATIQNNIFVAKGKDQQTASISSVKQDVRELGHFDRNVYARPFDDYLSFYIHNGNERAEVLDIEGWRAKLGKDHSSQGSPVKIPEYKVTHVDKHNKYSHGAYNTATSALHGIYGSNSRISWANNQLDGGTLQVEGRGNSSITMAVGAVKKSYYVLKFTAKATKEAYVDLTIMKSVVPFTEVAPKVTIKLDKGRKDYEVVFAVEDNELLASMRFAFKNTDLTYWLDNVGLYEAKAQLLDPKDYLRFEYNYSNQNKDIALDAAYVDARNKAYSGKVTLPPYSSIVLIRTSEVQTPVEQPNQAPSVSIISPSPNAEFEVGSAIEIAVQAEDKDGKINKVEFFHGDKLLGTSNSAPYTFNWEDVAQGEYSITAKATDDKSATSISQAVRVKVTLPVPIEVDKPGNPGNVGSKPVPPKQDEVSPVVPGGEFALYLNAGSRDDVSYDGKLFKGDVNFGNYLTGTSQTNINKAASAELLFQTERHADKLTYAIPVPNGVYTVKTYHNELWFGKGGPSSAKGRRVFNIAIEGQAVKDRFDLFEENNNRQAVMTFENIEVKDGKLDLEMLALQNRSTISGIAIESASMLGEDAPVPPVENEVPVSEDSQPAFSLHLNAGTDKDVEMDGRVFLGDVKYPAYYNSSTSVNVNLAASSNALFTTERHAEFLEYNIPVPNGIYTVQTFHNELWFGKGGPSSAKGRRVFDINIEGGLVEGKFDMFEANSNKEVVLTFEEIEVTDGVLHIEMVSSQNRSTVSAISIESVASTSKDARSKELNNPDYKVDDRQSTAYSLYLNVGSDKNTEYEGNTFLGDAAHSSFYSAQTSTNVNLKASDDVLFASERHADKLSYAIPVPNGTYTVETYHNELWFGIGAPAVKGRRVFDIHIEGAAVKNRFDLFDENNAPTKLTFKNIEVVDGQINIDFIASSNRATLSGLSIVSESKELANENLRMMTIEPEPETNVSQEIVRETKLYPNPASERVTLSVKGEHNLQSILIHDMNGQLLKDLDPATVMDGNGYYILALDGLPQGVYLVSLVGRQEVMERMRLIVKP